MTEAARSDQEAAGPAPLLSVGRRGPHVAGRAQQFHYYTKTHTPGPLGEDACAGHVALEIPAQVKNKQIQTK